jgi:asparagine synthase (glutamine-hydrolysing)
VSGGVGKLLVRQVARGLLPPSTAVAPKRPVQTPQREWLSSDLEDWTRDRIGQVLAVYGGTWLDAAATLREVETFAQGKRGNSAHIWGLISLALTTDVRARRQSSAIGCA